MTDLQILTAVKNNNGAINYTDLLNLNMSDAYRDPSADKYRINKLIEQKYLKGSTEAYGTISITDNGRLFLQDSYYLEEQNKKLDKNASNEKAKEKRHNWWVALIGAIVGSLSGIILDVVILLLEHC